MDYEELSVLVKMRHEFSELNKIFNEASKNQIQQKAKEKLKQIARKAKKKEKHKKKVAAKVKANAVAKANKKPSVNWTQSPSFCKSRAWKELRYEAIAKYGNTCMTCGRSPKDGIIIHVDHIKPKLIYPHLALKLDNLQILCAECNVGKSYKDKTDWR